MLIRIKSTPPGQAPKDVRDAWVGIILEATGRESNNAPLQRRMGADNLGGYIVPAASAFLRLREYNPEAHKWWFKHVPVAFFGDLIFHADVCEEVRLLQ